MSFYDIDYCRHCGENPVSHKEDYCEACLSEIYQPKPKFESDKPPYVGMKQYEIEAAVKIVNAMTACHFSKECADLIKNFLDAHTIIP